MKKIRPFRQIDGRNIYLRNILISDANKDYCDWLNDPQVNQYLESRFQKWTPGKLKAYIKNIKSDKEIFFFAIIRKDCGRHIGNIKLGPINSKHKYAEMGIIIGDKQSWGKGFATDAIKLTKYYAFHTLGLHKITAGVYCTNVGSLKAFQKAGFLVEGVLKKQYSCNGKYVDCILLGCVQG